MRTLVIFLVIILEQVGLGSLISVQPVNVNYQSSSLAMGASYLSEIKPSLYKIGEADAPNVSSRSYLVLDKNTNNILAEKDSDISIPMASLTKIMSAVIVLENTDLENTLVVSKNAVSAYGEGIDLRAGETLTVRDVLYAALLSSSNDACVALAEGVSESEDKFVELMNKKAQDLGLSKTHFTNSAGLDDPKHLSNVKDLARLTRYALLNETFAEIVSTKEKLITSAEGINHYLRNTNKLLGTIEGVFGVKTGLTGEAGECLVTLVEREESSIIVVTLGSEDRFSDTKNLINWVYQNFTFK
ncbi:D-alanyl-D-alanine carboxypeptidase [bacterium]|nr:D-alanyl-D-alanine carboxypeptidase [bacterium]